MIKLLDLIVETKQDSLARIMTDDIIKAVKSFLSSDEEFGEGTDRYDFINERISCEHFVTTISPEEMKYFLMHAGKRTKNSIASKGSIVEGSAEVGERPGILIRIHLDSTKFSQGNLTGMRSLYMDVLKVVRHEIEHLFQLSPALATSGREKDISRIIKPGLAGSTAMKGYRELPTEMEADAKAINLIKKKKRISFEDATREYYQDFAMNKKDANSMVSKMLKYAKKFNFGGH
jgi:hypothetical protein